MKSAILAIEYGPEGYQFVEIRITCLYKTIARLSFQSENAEADFTQALRFLELGRFRDVTFDGSIDNFLEGDECYMREPDEEWGLRVKRKEPGTTGKLKTQPFLDCP